LSLRKEYLGKRYGTLACLQAFRSADVGERFESHYHVLDTELKNKGYSLIPPSFFEEAAKNIDHHDRIPSAIRSDVLAV
jgi:hypothetical protein